MTQRFARLDPAGRVIEAVDLPDTIEELEVGENGAPVRGDDGSFRYRTRALELTDAFPAEIAAEFRPAPAEVGQGWRLDGGEWIAPPRAEH